MEATITMLSVMFLLWAAAVWASYREDPGDPRERRPISVEDGSLATNRYKKGA
ncbi:MAG: hypothetical protein KC594_14160 [Nitrospira sp.]|nr:hypothetical protein [Nitrospira sp.]HNP31489.1 hypothetical protein [Nitrospirales bacterium]